MLEALAVANGASFFIADSVDELRDAVPAGPLTAGELETLEMLRGLGGRSTVSVFAANARLEPSAANNRLMSVSEKGLIQWQDRSRREGRLYFDPRTAVPAEDPADPAAADFGVPEEIRNDVAAIAQLQGRDPGSVYVEAMGEFVDRHRDYLIEEHERLRKAIAEDDEEVLKASARRYAKKQAVARAREIRRRSKNPAGQ